MHGLIFETSIWLLAGSTRLFHHKLFTPTEIQNWIPAELPSCGNCCKSKTLQPCTQLNSELNALSDLRTCHLETDMLSSSQIQTQFTKLQTESEQSADVTSKLSVASVAIPMCRSTLSTQAALTKQPPCQQQERHKADLLKLSMRLKSCK
jgi:hypothetical protein